MNQEDKELLLKDLCARLPYGVYVNYKNVENKEGIIMLNPYNIQHIYSGWWKKYKPYLRPMSSMTEEERKEYYTFQYKFTLQEYDCQELNKETFLEYLDWLNKNHFDYCNLIEKNLAIEVTEENNPYKN